MRPSAKRAALLGLFILIGCGESGARVTGSLQEGGKPVVLKENEEISISFVSVDPEAKVNLATADYHADRGAFTVRGPERDSIPAGEYKIVIALTPYQENTPDRFGGAFAEEKTPLRYTVTNDSTQEIVIDVQEKSVKKK
jgi:hypothetical protein